MSEHSTPPAHSPARRLLDLIRSPEILVMPGAYDPITARLVEEAGFAAVQCSGYGISLAHLGLPDYGFIGLHEMADRTARIVQAVSIPVMADGDTGFGNAVNAYHAVRAFERAGAAGVNIEDQSLPKRCGHLDGKELISVRDAVAKIKACADARVDPCFVINARTDALSVGGVAEVIDRGNAYLEAGATMIFVEGIDGPTTAQQVVAGIRGPVAINAVEGGKSDAEFGFSQMQAIGIARVSLPGTTMFAAIHGIRTVLQAVQRQGGIRGYEDQIADFRQMNALARMPDVLALEKKYLTR